MKRIHSRRKGIDRSSVRSGSSGHVAFLVLVMMVLWIPSAQAHAPHDVIHTVVVSPDFASDQMIFAKVQLSDRLLFARSSDGGRSWLEYASPVLTYNIKRIAVSPGFAADGTLFAATKQQGVWRSTDRGLTWHAVNTGLVSLEAYDVSLSPNFAADGTLLAGTKKGLFRSTDRGDTWTETGTGLIDTVITAVRHASDDPDVVFAGGYFIHRSDDGGLTWQHLEHQGDQMEIIVVSPDFQNDGSLAVLLKGSDGIFGSADGGENWEPANTGLSDLDVNDITFADDGTVFAVTSTDGCFRADALFMPWTLFDEGFEDLSHQTDRHYRSVAASPEFSLDDTVFVGAFEGFFKSVDRGETWKQSDVYHLLICRCLSPSPDFGEDRLLYVADFGGGPFLWRADGSTGPQGPPKKASDTRSRGPRRTPRMLPGGAPTLENPTLTTPRPTWEALAHSITSLHSSVLVTSPDFAADQTLFYGYQG
ncbi:MAG: WD40/YVTN/BNR-like repeat-containing protein, partial [Planctomycetota bacterium]